MAGLLPVFSSMGQGLPPHASSASVAASAINSVGVDLLHRTGRMGANTLLSPYSIETALAMTYAGADGATHDEMARVLHLQPDAMQVANNFTALQRLLNETVQLSVRAADAVKKYGVTNDAITLDVANRLFGQQGHDFRPAFLDLVKTKYNAPFEPLDFHTNAAGATKTINDWVTQQTNQRIVGLIPNGVLDDLTRLVLVNALYFKAPWAEPFSASATKSLPFHIGKTREQVPMMSVQKSFGYAKESGATIVSVPYSGGELQFLIILPDDTNGLAKTEAALTADELAKWANLPAREVKLTLPKFRIEPPTMPLGEALQMMGMTNAFDVPHGSANFDRMAPRKPNDYLYISRVFHKTFISVDEKGTEAAAATAVALATRSMQKPEPVPEVNVDHPFIFAIQHRASGACLFLGHEVNPRLTYL